MTSSCVVQFAKRPVPGRVKTRMQPDLSEQESVQLHIRLLEFTRSTLSATRDWDYQLWFSEKSLPQDPVSDFYEGAQLQQGDDLGQRMSHCFETLLERYEQVILIGSDCPYFSVGHLQQVADYLLKGSEVVLTPAHDGGYVLIALRRFSASLFQGIEWGTDRVLDQTLERLQQLAWPYQLMPALGDIDRPQDLSDFLGAPEAELVLGSVLYDSLSRLRA
ncbi:MAG: TIGR04282 family arsenosugar biosynthesis glycosyltransferase [Candidatus Pelagadaptatus aseana]|uniref:TIGR04282 family arsenosugar biosynthesis glycosyltransferase n=1 Tax=Candidatus Pelagadaptatus aseana TaxID=3120508 RepID=UPI0039B228DD